MSTVYVECPLVNEFGTSYGRYIVQFRGNTQNLIDLAKKEMPGSSLANFPEKHIKTTRIPASTQNLKNIIIHGNEVFTNCEDLLDFYFEG